MPTRADYQAHIPNSINALLALDKSIGGSSIGQRIIDLVKVRISQINGCLFCLDMHSKEAKVHGERELRLYHLALWRESALFTEREKAALKWAEMLTRPGPYGIADEDYEKAAAQFSEKEISDLTVAISSINAWKRIGIAFRPTAGSLDKVMGLDKAGLK